MASEAIWGSATALTGMCLVWSLIERLSLRLASNISASPSLVFPLWGIVLGVPIFYLSHKRYNWYRKNRIYGTQSPPLYPNRDAILGLDWLKDMSKALKEHQLLNVWDGLLHSVGYTFWYQSAGEWSLLTADPDNMKVMLATNFDDWPIGGPRQTSTILTLGPHAIFSTNGEEWQQGRALMRPTFVRNQVADLECQDRHVERFLARIPKDGSKLDLQELFYLFTMDSSTDFMFGYSTDILVNAAKETTEFAAAFDHSVRMSANRARLGWLAFLKPDAKFDESVATIRRFVERYITKAVEEDQVKERPYVFLNELLNSGVSTVHIRDQLLAMIVGGRDTTASTLSALFWTLARRPEIVKSLRDEIEILDDRKPTWEELKDMKYLNMVLKEALRLFPPVATNARCAGRDTVLPKGGGPDGQSPVFVPKGTPCRWSLYTLQRRKDIFGEDADEFRPERWEKLRPGNWAYLPFHGGPRTCIGQQFALTQLQYTLVRIFQTFESVEARDERPMLQAVGATNSLPNGCWVSLKAVSAA